MTVTISRLYDDYASATRAVAELEATGIPHSDISIIANNSDNWYAADKTGSRPGLASVASALAASGASG